MTAAQAGGYAVPAFNTNGASYDITRAALEAAQEMGSPLFLQEYEPNAEYRGIRYFVNHARLLCDELGITVPVVLHVDHGHSYESALRAMAAGCTSYMIDASHESLDDNIALTRQVVRAARALGCSVEAEVGHVQGNDPAAVCPVGRAPIPERPSASPATTAVADAVRFASAVEVDMLAVAVGTTHGLYQSQTAIDFGLLRELRAAVAVPLVQHGTSGIALDDLTRLVACGISKVNFGEAFRYRYVHDFGTLTDTLEHGWHAWRIKRVLKDRIKADMKAIIAALGSAGKA